MLVGMITNRPKFLRSLFSALILGTFTGCIGYVEGPPRQSRVYAQPTPAYAQTEIVVQDDYVYYPGYQVYYSNTRHQYIYLEGRAWVTRPAPPRVSVEVLLAAPSVRVDFHDSPSRHHQIIARTYPTNWAPPGQMKEKHENNGRGHQEGR
jgi:hypothetical protein